MTKPVAIISGGNGLIGSAIAQRLQNENYQVVIFSRTGVDKHIPGVTPFRCDITNANEVEEMLEKIETTIGPIVIGIHCAQTPIVRKKITQIDLGIFRAQFETSVFGGFLFFRTLAERMSLRKNGVLIGITSSVLDEEKIEGGFGGYISSKYALRGFIKELAYAVRGNGVRIYDVAPGFIVGGLNGDLPERMGELIKQKHNVESLTSEDDVAKVVVGLCGDETMRDQLVHVVDTTRK